MYFLRALAALSQTVSIQHTDHSQGQEAWHKLWLRTLALGCQHQEEAQKRRPLLRFSQVQPHSTHWQLATVHVWQLHPLGSGLLGPSGGSLASSQA